MTIHLKNFFFFRFFFLLSLFFFLHSPAQATVKTDLLFVLYDAGETNMLQPVWSEFKNNHVNFRILVMGTSRSLLGADNEAVLDISKDCEIESSLDQKTWDRFRALSPNDLHKIEKCIQPKIIVTGMASQAQHQISQMYRSQGKKVFGSYDSLSPIQPSSVAFLFLDDIDVLLVPSEKLKDAIQPSHPKLDIQVSGQPAFEKWAIASKNLDRATILKKLPYLDSKKKTVLYAGGYGPNYEEAFGLFIRAAKSLDQFNYIVTLHPKVDGSLERKVIAAHFQNTSLGADASVNSPIHIASKTISTMEIGFISSIVVSQGSTVGTQALFMGKPVIYFDVPGSTYSDITVENGWSKKITDLADFKTVLAQQLDQEKEKPFDIYQAAGIPVGASTKIVEIILNAVENENGP